MTILNSTAEMIDLGGGKFRNEISVRPAFYQSNGAWRRVKNELGNSGDQNFTIGVDELMQFRVRSNLVGNAPVIHIGHGGEHVRITPLNTNNVAGTVVENSIIYPEAWTNADLKLTIGGHVIRKEIILRAGHPASFAFRLDEKNYSNKLILHDPYLSKNGLTVPLTWVQSTQGGKTILTVTLPEGDWSGWILDPTYTSQPDETSGEDTFLRSTNTTTNYGTQPILQVGEFPGVARIHRSLIKFDLSSIPSTNTVSSAILSLWINADNSNNARTANAYRVLRNWVESQATWNAWSTGNNWTTAGCGSDGNDADLTNSHGSCSFTASETVGAEKQFSMTVSEIQKFINGTYANNYGWILRMNTETDDQYDFESSSSATASIRPKLVIEHAAAATNAFFAMF